MKKLIIAILLVFASAMSFAQTFDPEVVINGLKDDKVKGTMKRMSLSTDIRLPLVVRTPAVQFTFTQIEKIDGDWRLAQPFTIGYSYIYTFATGILHPDTSLTVENRFFFGAGANYGFKTGSDNQIVNSLPIGAIIGYSRFGLFGGYDVINGKPMVGISANLLNFPLFQKSTRFSVRDNK